MKHDDPRHGTTAGHNAGCRCADCQGAKLRYDKRRRWESSQGFARLVPSRGTRRRIRALQAIGHAFPAIGLAADLSPKTIADLCYRSERVSANTARAVSVAYEHLCMKPGTTGYARRSRLAAARKGWAPPLAWDDIDRDPHPTGYLINDGEPDPVVITRILAGEWRLTATPEERAEVIARWEGSDAHLERLTGWNVARDRRAARERAA